MNRTIWLSSTGTGNDRSFTVPTNRLWKLKSVRAVLTSSDTVGNRQLQLTVDPALVGDTNPYIDVRAGAVQAASLTYYYQFFDGAARMTAVADTDWLSVQLPANFELAPASVIRVFDNGNVDASSDVLDVRVLLEMRGGTN